MNDPKTPVTDHPLDDGFVGAGRPLGSFSSPISDEDARRLEEAWNDMAFYNAAMNEGAVTAGWAPKPTVDPDRTAVTEDSQIAIPNEKDLANYLEQYRPRLLAMIASRLDPKARGRRDAADLLQDVYITARGRLDAYAQSGMTPYAWLYQVALDRIFDDHGYQHARCRDVSKERGLPDESSASLVSQLAEPAINPSQDAAEKELRALMHERLTTVLPLLAPDDREILLKHNFDGLSLAEIAQVLGVSHATARVRYARARLKLRDNWIRLFGEWSSQEGPG